MTVRAVAQPRQRAAQTYATSSNPIASGRRHDARPRSRRLPAVRAPRRSFARIRAMLIVGLFPPIALLAAGCATAPVTHSAGTFIEEFDGFPIYHGQPQRRFRVLGPVYNAAAAARGVSPMKRSSVATARGLGADAILLVVTSGTSNDPERANGGAAASGSQAKWERAVAIEWE